MGQALLALDFNNDIVNANGRFGQSHGLAAQAAAKQLPEHVSTAVRSARAAGDPVMWAYPGPVVFTSNGMEPSDAWGSAIDPAYGIPGPDETVYAKEGYSALSGTSMAADLRALDVDTLLLCGVSTSVVVLHTARDALEQGFQVRVLEDCCADGSPEAHTNALASMPDGVDVTQSEKVWTA